ncbi:hypothetical protein B566_EDAN006874 [Ephemera danica]|nr:hypothetical protein B566_EDAN006874 [Ephemera danica]
MRFLLLILASAVALSNAQLPTLYEYYTSGGVTEGLQALSTGFTLNKLPITLYSAAIHYFRVPPAYWRDRLRKARAAGINTIETYVPWNLHEPRLGEFDFGASGNDLSFMLDVRSFVQMAQEEDMFVIFRPGPYICSEWDFGGLPSWLLRYEGIQLRTSDPIFLGHVKNYLDNLLPLVSDLAFTKGGPIIAMQVENEYGGYGLPLTSRDTAYLIYIRDLYVNHSMDSLYFTSDSPALNGDIGAIPGELQTANFDNNPAEQFDALLTLQPDKPLMAMEYWTGWFDHWMQPRHTGGNTPAEFAEYLSVIFSYNGSVNFYMFHGGTSFGFMNGANVFPVFPFYAADVSSYDYSAPLSEAADYTEKYNYARDLIALDNKVQTLIPQQPPETIKTAYPIVQVTEYIPIFDVLAQVVIIITRGMVVRLYKLFAV